MDIIDTSDLIKERDDCKQTVVNMTGTLIII